MATLLTIGELADRVGLRTSALRYYEEQGLLSPDARSEGGYRLYKPEAEATLHFIQRAQRLGFSLENIRTLLEGIREQNMDDQRILRIAETRFLEMERHLTEQLVLRHEMRMFLSDFQHNATGQPIFERLLEHVCIGPARAESANLLLSWLLERSDCALASSDVQALLEALGDQHIHLWQDGNGYRILVTGHDEDAERALTELTRLEAICQIHRVPQLRRNDEGYLFIVSGDNAFIYAQLFLALGQL